MTDRDRGNLGLYRQVHQRLRGGDTWCWP
jgi:hypothetical protein